MLVSMRAYIFPPCFTHMLWNTRLNCLDVAGTKPCCCSFVLGSGEARADLKACCQSESLYQSVITYGTLQGRDRCVSAHLSLTWRFVNRRSSHGGGGGEIDIKGGAWT